MSDQLQKAQELIEADHLDEAEAILRRLVKRRSSKFGALFRLGVIEDKRQRYQKSRVFYSRALGVASNVPEAHFNLAVALRNLGERRKAISHFRQAILLKPDFGRAYGAFSEAVRFQPGHPMFAVIEDRLGHDEVSQEDRCHLHFAAGKAYDDIGEYDRALAQL
jgi:tetratricopeptide (TPR) repeat protein